MIGKLIQSLRGAIEERKHSLSPQEVAALSRMVDEKAREFIEVRLGVPIHKFTSYDSYLKAGCKKVWASMRAVDLIAATAVSANFKVVDTRSQEGNTQVAMSPKDQEWMRFAKGGFLERPNPYDTWEELIKLTVAHLEFTGNGYWVKDDFDLRGRPTALFPLLPQHVEAVPDRLNKVALYKYRVNGQTLEFKPEDVLHFRYPNPDDIMLGLGAIESGESIYKRFLAKNDLDLQFMSNGSQPSGILTLDDASVTDEEEWDKLKTKYNKEYGGVKNAGRTAFLNGKWSYHKLGLTMQEMEAIESEKWTVEQIFMNHGVPLSIAGVRNASNYACVPAGELVTTKHGPVPIEELSAGDTIYQFDPVEGTIEVPVEAIIEQPDAEVLELRTTNRMLRASDNHPVLCLKRTPGTGRYGKRVEAELEYRRMDEISVGDAIVCLDELPEGKGRIPLDTWHESEAAYALGQYVGDGCGASMTRARIGGFSIATHEDEGYQDVVAEAVHKGFGFAVSKCRTYIRWHSADFAEEMVKAGFSGRSGEKRIPEWVFSMSNELKMQFAAGLIDSDGTVAPRGTIVFSVANELLARDFQHLLMSLGIPTANVLPCHQKTNFGEVTNWRFSCGILAENKRIPLRHPKKLGRLLAAETKGGKKGKGIAYSLHLPESFSLPKGYGLQKVTSIRSLGVMPVFDLATVKNHNFIVSGIVTHNTSKMEEANFRRYKVVPVIDIIVGRINADGFLQAAAPGLKLAYELYGVIDVEQIAKVHLPLVREGVITRNEMRELVGFKRLEDNPHMDQITVPAHSIPIELAGLANLSNEDMLRVYGDIIGGATEDAIDDIDIPDNPGGSNGGGSDGDDDKPNSPNSGPFPPPKKGKASPVRSYPARPRSGKKGRR